MSLLCFRAAAVFCAAFVASVVHGADAPAPVVSLSLRGVADRTVEQGEPLSVAVRLSGPRESGATVELAPASGAWTDAVSVEIAKDKSSPALARATAIGNPETPRATLDRNRVAGGPWLFSSAAMQGITPGDYVVRVRLKVETGPGWKGEVLSNPFALKVVAPSAAPERVLQRALSRANEAMLANRGEEAAGFLDAVLKTAPDQREVLLLRAVVAERAGNVPAALMCVNRASRGLLPGGPPPPDLHELRTRLQTKLTQPAAAGETFNPPAWSWPPVEVFAGVANAAAAAKAQTLATAPARATVPAPVPVPAPAPGSPPAKAATAPAPAVSAPVARPTSVATPAIAGQPQLPPAAGTNAPAVGTVVPAGELEDKKIRADATGRWAATAQAKSSYSNPNYGPAKATGAPDVNVAGDSIDAWCPGVQNSGTDWLEVTFAQPVRAIGVRVRQNHNPGAIVKVEAIAADGTIHLWWEGKDPFIEPAIRDIAWFGVKVPPTGYAVARIKVTLDLASRPGWKQIDAVQLVAAAEEK